MLLLVCATLCGAAAGLRVLGVQGLSKVYPSQRFFSRWGLGSANLTALDRVSLNLTSPIVTLLGASGSGKSTLAKVLAGREQPSSGRILLSHASASDRRECCAYIDQHFYMSYDANALSHSLLGALLNDKEADQTSAMRRAAQTLPNIKASSLLTSQRRAFDVLLSLSRIPSDLAESPLIVLDEYLDKDARCTLQLTKAFLAHLCSSIALQVLIVTHSRSVLEVFSDHAVVLSKGGVHSSSTSGLARLSFPSQLQLIP